MPIDITVREHSQGDGTSTHLEEVDAGDGLDATETAAIVREMPNTDDTVEINGTTYHNVDGRLVSNTSLGEMLDNYTSAPYFFTTGEGGSILDFSLRPGYFSILGHGGFGVEGMGRYIFRGTHEHSGVSSELSLGGVSNLSGDHGSVMSGFRAGVRFIYAGEIISGSRWGLDLLTGAGLTVQQITSPHCADTTPDNSARIDDSARGARGTTGGDPLVPTDHDPGKCGYYAGGLLRRDRTGILLDPHLFIGADVRWAPGNGSVRLHAGLWATLGYDVGEVSGPSPGNDSIAVRGLDLASGISLGIELFGHPVDDPADDEDASVGMPTATTPAETPETTEPVEDSAEVGEVAAIAPPTATLAGMRVMSAGEVRARRPRVNTDFTFSQDPIVVTGLQSTAAAHVQIRAGDTILWEGDLTEGANQDIIVIARNAQRTEFQGKLQIFQRTSAADADQATYDQGTEIPEDIDIRAH